jgi:hypothetical protein
VVEPTGPEILVFTHLAGQELAVVLKERHLFSPGDMINLTPHPRHHPPVRQGTGERSTPDGRACPRRPALVDPAGLRTDCSRAPSLAPRERSQSAP